MKLLLIFIATIAYGQVDFEDCALSGRFSFKDGLIEKYFTCKNNEIVNLEGRWTIETDRNGDTVRREYESWWFGETTNFGKAPIGFRPNLNKQDLRPCIDHGLARVSPCIRDSGQIARDPFVRFFTDCKAGEESGNNTGYMSERITFKCNKDQVKVRISGAWGEEFQGHWNYHLTLGEVDMTPNWEEDPLEIILFSKGFQKWCRTEVGWRLCGSVDEPKIYHGKPPVFTRLP